MSIYQISTKFNSALSRLSERDRLAISNYVILLEEIIDTRNNALLEIEQELKNFREPMGMLSSDTQALIRNIHDIIEKLKE